MLTLSLPLCLLSSLPHPNFSTGWRLTDSQAFESVSHVFDSCVYKGLLGLLRDEVEMENQGILPAHAVGIWSLELSKGTGGCESPSALYWALKGVLASDH